VDRLGGASGILARDTATNSTSFASVLNLMLTGKDADAVKRHPWFKRIDFTRLYESAAPWTPDLTSDADTRYFDQGALDAGLTGPYAAGLNGSIAEKLHSSEQAAPQEGVESTKQDAPKNETEEAMELRKKLAFKGFTFRGSSGMRGMRPDPAQSPSTSTRSSRK
jgi:hypothetical protein